MHPPEPPDLPRAVVDSLVAYARAMAAYTEWDIEQGAAHGHPEHPQARANVDGWTFTALGLEESYDGID